ncbi:hypothetical protein Trydic_g3900 [Trypoxylus dichotomus]
MIIHISVWPDVKAVVVAQPERKRASEVPIVTTKSFVTSVTRSAVSFHVRTVTSLPSLPCLAASFCPPFAVDIVVVDVFVLLLYRSRRYHLPYYIIASANGERDGERGSQSGFARPRKRIASVSTNTRIIVLVLLVFL